MAVVNVFVVLPASVILPLAVHDRLCDVFAKLPLVTSHVVFALSAVPSYVLLWLLAFIVTALGDIEQLNVTSFTSPLDHIYPSFNLVCEPASTLSLLIRPYFKLSVDGTLAKLWLSPLYVNVLHIEFVGFVTPVFTTSVLLLLTSVVSSNEIPS